MSALFELKVEFNVSIRCANALSAFANVSFTESTFADTSLISTPMSSGASVQSVAILPFSSLAL